MKILKIDISRYETYYVIIMLGLYGSQYDHSLGCLLCCGVFCLDATTIFLLTFASPNMFICLFAERKHEYVSQSLQHLLPPAVSFDNEMSSIESSTYQSQHVIC